MRLIPLVPALLLTASAAVAADHDADLRLTVGAVPGIDQVKITDAKDPSGAPDPAQNGTSSGKAKYGFTIEPGLMFAADWHGLGVVGGPSLFFSTARGENDVGAVENKRKLTSYGLLFELGPTFQWDWLRLEILPMVGAGFAHCKAEVTSLGTNVQFNSDPGFCFQYGIRAGLYASNDEGLVGFQVGYQGYQARVKYGSSASPARDSDTETYTGSGIMGAFVAGVAF
jgi:hypothetical protein